ncbi:hypothetical protein M8371_33385, partial [Klebsiella pneumoniae]|nr:hypothetical protein [Klebsiella pneumoniae]
WCKADWLPAFEERNYTPDVELVGDFAGTLNKLAQNIDHRLVLSPQAAGVLPDTQHQLQPLGPPGGPPHPCSPVSCTTP